MAHLVVEWVDGADSVYDYVEFIVNGYWIESSLLYGLVRYAYIQLELFHSVP